MLGQDVADSHMRSLNFHMKRRTECLFALGQPKAPPKLARGPTCSTANLMHHLYHGRSRVLANVRDDLRFFASCELSECRLLLDGSATCFCL